MMTVLLRINWGKIDVKYLAIAVMLRLLKLTVFKQSFKTLTLIEKLGPY